MNIAVRYYSRSGNTKLLAETIANETHVKAVSVDSIDLIKKALKENDIEVYDEFIYAKNKPSLEKLEEAKNIVKKLC